VFPWVPRDRIYRTAGDTKGEKRCWKFGRHGCVFHRKIDRRSIEKNGKMIRRERVVNDYHVLQVFHRHLVRNAVARRCGVALPINSRSVESAIRAKALPRSFFTREIPRYVEATCIRWNMQRASTRETRTLSRFYQPEIRILISVTRVLTRRDALEAGSMGSSSTVASMTSPTRNEIQKSIGCAILFCDIKFCEWNLYRSMFVSTRRFMREDSLRFIKCAVV